MKVRLTADYRGVLSDEAYYTAGDYVAGVDMTPAHAQALVEAGRAELLEADLIEQPAPVKVVKRGRKAQGL